MVEVRVLGPVQVLADGRPFPFARRQQRLIAGILALESNQLISGDRLIDLIWAGSPPKQARATVQSRISEFRTMLSDFGVDRQVRLLTHGDGYIFEIDPHRVDALRFRQVATGWRKTGSDAQACLDLRGALGLWRGPFLGGELDHESLASLRHGLEAARLTALEDLFELELKLGKHSEVVDEILEVASGNPLRERLTELLMLSLHRTGRSAEALRAYDGWRKWLREELGVNPGRQIQEIHLMMLSSEPESGAETSSRLEPVGGAGQRSFKPTTPGILPPDILDFTGREEEITFIQEVVTRVGEGAPLVAISGCGGIGKSAVSVRAAHSLRAEFPDGQLYANLRGADEQEPAEPFAVLGRFLRALGVEGLAAPETLEDRADLYRDLLSDRRVLVVLDNAASDHQILPLLPGGPSCGVIVNSRARIGATISARTISLDVLGEEQAIDLLSNVAGEARVAAESAAADELAGLCGHLPLAVKVVGAKLVAKPHWSIEKLVAILRDERSRLDHLSHGHLDVRATIAVSYSTLPEAAQRLLRRLGHLGLADISGWVSAALLDLSAAEAERELEVLFDAQLIDAVGLGSSGDTRYRMHDLVRLFAREKAEAEEKPAELVDGIVRAYACCLHIAEAQYRKLHGGDFQNITGSGRRWSPGEDFVSALVAHPMTWFDGDRMTIISMINRAAREGQATLCWEIACTTAPFFEMRQLFDELNDALDVAYRAAEQAEESRGQAAILYRMAGNCANRGEHDKASDLVKRAEEIFDATGDVHGKATALTLAGMLDRFRGAPDSALDRYRQALPLLQEFGDLGGAALVQRGIAQIHLDRAELGLAEEFFEQALSVYRTCGSPRGEVQVLFWLGMLRLRQGHWQEAVVRFDHALTISRHLGDRAGEAQCLRGLGLGYQQSGDLARAREVLRSALQLVRQPRPTMIEGHILHTLAELA